MDHIPERDLPVCSGVILNAAAFPCEAAPVVSSAALEAETVSLLFFAACELYPGALSFNGVKESYETVISNVKQNGVSALFEKNGLAESSWLFVIVIDCLLLLMLFVLSVIGAIKLIRKCWVPAVFLIGTVLYNIIICCQPVGYGSYPRFRLSFSMISIILVACSFGIRTIKSKKSKNKASAESDQA